MSSTIQEQIEAIKHFADSPPPLKERLADAVATLERNRWISVSEQLPDRDTYCFVSDGKKIFCSCYRPDLKMKWEDLYGFHKNFVKYWKPLDLPPDKQ